MLNLFADFASYICHHCDKTFDDSYLMCFIYLSVCMSVCLPTENKKTADQKV